MKELERAKVLIDKNRLIFAVIVFWIIVSNLLYFSEVDEFSCLSFTNGSFQGTPKPDWMILWHQFTLGYVSLYDTVFEAANPSYSFGSVTCSQSVFSEIGYFSFIFLPILTIVMLTAAVKWVRRA